MKRSHRLLLALLGAAAVSCGSSSSGGGAHARAHVDQSTTAPDAQSTAVPTSGTSPNPAASGAASADPAAPASTVPQPGGQGRPAATAPAPGRTAPASTPVPAGPGAQPPAGWKLVTYFTAVESFHHGPPQKVSGCPLNGPDNCSNGTADLGSYPSDFIDLVKVEGTGRIDVNTAHKGQYLAYDPQDGFSLDTAASDVAGNPLKAFVSAAADDAVPLGTHFRVLDCGSDRTSGQPPAAAGCARLSSPDWVVVDSSGKPAGSRELDLYVGEEDRPNFANGVSYVIDTQNARTTLK